MCIKTEGHTLLSLLYRDSGRSRFWAQEERAVPRLAQCCLTPKPTFALGSCLLQLHSLALTFPSIWGLLTL